jgi:hypothetical protein
MLIVKGFGVALGTFFAASVALIAYFVARGGVMIPMSSLLRAGSFLVGAGLGTTLTGSGI